LCQGESEEKAMSKHVKLRGQEKMIDADLKRNPGIGQSKGSFATGEPPFAAEGNSTFEGDVENDTTPQGGVDPRHLGRTNK
jgi:hypothetical protein